MMQLSKRIPAHNKTEKFLWCTKAWMLWGAFSKARKGMGLPYTKQCYWCHHKFVPGDMMALAAPTKGENRLLCHACATELLKSNLPQEGL